MLFSITKKPLWWLFYVLLSWLGQQSLVSAYSSGAPNSKRVCSSLTPGHGSKQNAVSPYKLILVDVDGQLGLNLVATSQVTFAGFIVQARDANNHEKIIDGEFAETENTQVKGCNSGKGNTWTHNSGQPKTQVSTIWVAPRHFNGSIIFIGTVVQVKQAYFDKITSEPAYIVNGVPVDSKEYAKYFSASVSEHQPMEELLSSSEFDYEQCNHKMCIGLGAEENCLPSKTCQALLTATQNSQGDSEFTIFAKPANDYKSKYYSIGFSHDNKMGDDLVVDCYVDSAGNAKIGLSFNVGKSNEVLSSPDVLREKIAQFKEGMVSCRWKLGRKLLVNGQEFNFIDNKYHIFLAQGDLENDNGYKQYHDLKTRSSESVNLALVGALESKDLSYLIKIHGSLMVIAWLGSVSIAIVLARYFKDAWNNSLLCGVKVWFAFHRGLMVLSIVLMIIAQLCIFYYVGEYRIGLHQVLGSIAFAFALFQPIGALFRPHPDASNRWLFNWLHWFGGNAGHILATAAILVSTKLKVANLPESFLYVAISWILFHVTLHLLFQFNSLCAHKSRTSDIALNDMQNGGNMYIEKEPSSSKNTFGGLFLAVYVLVVALLVTILVLLISSPNSISGRVPFL